LAGKWQELPKEIAPRIASVAFLLTPETATYFECWQAHSKPLLSP